MGQEGPYVHKDIAQALAEFQRCCAPIKLLILSFVGKALTAQRRHEYGVAVEQARQQGVKFASIHIANDKFGRAGKADALHGLGVLMDDQAIPAFKNFPSFGPKGVANALENVKDFIESRQRSSIQAVQRSALQIPRPGMLG